MGDSEKRQKHKENKKKSILDFKNIKATFAAGIFVIAAIVKDFVGLFKTIPNYIIALGLLFLLILCYIITVSYNI